MSKRTEKTIQILEAVSEYGGRCVSWLVLLLVILTLIVAVPRYLLSNEAFLSLNLMALDWEAIRNVYGQSVNALSDSIQYVHAIIFMVGVSYAMKHNDHVRIDILYRNRTEHGQAWINIIGCLLLFYPTFIFLLLMSWDYVLIAWTIGEASSRPGGLPFIYLLKSLLIIMPIMMIIQGTALLLRNIQILRDRPCADSDVYE